MFIASIGFSSLYIKFNFGETFEIRKLVGVLLRKFKAVLSSFPKIKYFCSVKTSSQCR